MKAHLSENPPTREAAAADWFALKRSGLMTGAQALALNDWLQDPQNGAAYEAVAQTWSLLGAVRDEPEMLAMREGAERAHRLSGRWLAGALVAASIAAAVIVGLPQLAPELSRALPLAAPAEQTFSTGIGQMTTMTLPDGSVVTLDADTVLRMRQSGSERLVTMDRGRAFFRVARDPARPFSVMAAGQRVTADGTSFDVRLTKDCFELVLVEGKVRVADASVFRRRQTAELDAGSRLVVEDRGRWDVTRVNVERETSWLRGWLTYDNEPMGAIAEDLNRHSTKKVVIRDREVAATPMMGAFKPGDVEGFVKAARFYRFASVASETDEAVVLVAP